MAVAVDQVFRRPVLVLERVPRRVLVVERNRVADAKAVHRAPHVPGHMLECELGCVDAEHDEPAPSIGPVPGLHVRQRAQAVDARVGPEVDQDDLAAELPKSERVAVDPRRETGELRGLPEVPQRGARSLLARASAQPPQLALGPVALLDLALERLRVAGDRSLEVPIDIERDRQRGQPDRDPEALPDTVRVRPQGAHRRPAAERHEEHGDGCADGVRDGEHDRACPDILRRTDHGDRGQHRPRAGNEHEPEARSEQEPAPEVPTRPPRQAEERPLDDLLHFREEQRRRDEEQEPDRDVSQQVLR